MAQYFSPGVYIEEYEESPRTIEGIGTSVGGFVGLAQKGPTSGKPVLVTSYKEFVRQFGAPLSAFAYGEYRYLGPSVEQFFVNGGAACYVMRVIAPDAKCASAKSGILYIEAANEGAWGNRVQITFHTVTKRKMQLVGKNGEAYIAKNADGFREGDIVVCDGEYNRIATIFDNSITFETPFKNDIVDSGLIPRTALKLVETDLSVRYGDEVEHYAQLSFNTASPNYIAYRMAGSELVNVTVEQIGSAVNPTEAILGKGNESGMLLLEGGQDGSVSKVTAGTYIGEDNGAGLRTGLEAFAENNNVSMMAVPGITIPEVVVALVAQCERMKNRFAVIDMPKEAYKVNELLQYREIIDSTYAAMYHPWIQVFDKASNKPDFVPPSGAMIGIYARTDLTRGVHKAPANETVFCTGLKQNYTKQEQDLLNPAGINLLRVLPSQCIRVWGARTAGSNTNFKYINVRRLFIYVEESIKASTSWVVFEPNDAGLWNRVRLTIESFLDGLFRAGMLAGGTSSDAYFVEIGASTMTKDDILSGRLICNIGIAPSRPAEFVVFRITQFTAEVSGSAS